MKLETVATVAALGVIGWIGWQEVSKRRRREPEPVALTQPGIEDKWDLMPTPDWVSRRSTPPTNTAVSTLSPEGMVNLQSQIPAVGVSMRRALVQ